MAAMMMMSSVRESFVNLRKHGMFPDYQYQQTPLQIRLYDWLILR
jgi:hypothetical protein